MSVVSILSMDTLATDKEQLRTRLLLLLGQSFTFGILVALVVIIGNTLFLSDFSATFLPYVYFAVAVLGTLLSYATTRAQKNWSVPTVALATMAAFILLFGIIWFARITTGALWVSFALISTYPLVLRMSFVILGWQAGQLFDVRQIKRLFPHIVTGFVVGFIAGGLIMPFLLNLFNAAEHIILLMALASLVILLLVARVGRQFAGDFQLETKKTRRRESLSLLQLLRKPFVRWMFFYQLLMAVVSKFTDYLLLAQTEARYATEAETAQFFSSFYTILNSVDLFLLLVVAAVFLRRFGLKAGLLANPLFLTLNFGLMLVIGPIFGDSSMVFFLLVIVSRISIVTLTDATTRTSVNATYQALPAQERSMAQTAAEGMATQLALGIVGLVLLLFNAIPALNIIHVAFVTFVLALLWSIDSLALYRTYAKRLRQTIKRRTLPEVELTVNDAAGFAAVNQLLQSGRVNEVRLALDLLERANHRSLRTHLLALAAHDQPAIRVEALRHIEQHKITSPFARALVQGVLSDDDDPTVRGAALQTLCALDEADAVPQVTPYLNEQCASVQQGALVGLLRYGGIAGIMAAAPKLQTVDHTTAMADRIAIAEIIGAVQRQDFYEPLLVLLQDEDDAVRRAALEAAAQVKHPRLLPFIVDNLQYTATRSTAIATLIASGSTILPFVAAQLEGKIEDKVGSSVNEITRLVRVCGQMGGAEPIALLRQHMLHPCRAIQEQVIIALSRCGFQASAADRPLVEECLQRQIDHAATVLAVMRDIGTDSEVHNLQRALQDEQKRCARQIFMLLSLIYDRNAFLRAADQLANGEKNAQALAIELLEITLSREEKALLFPLIEPQLTSDQRLAQLPQMLQTAHYARERWLLEIVNDPTGRWQEPWLQACAIYAVGKLGIATCAEFHAGVKSISRHSNALLRETASWALQATHVSRFQQILNGVNPQPHPTP